MFVCVVKVRIAAVSKSLVPQHSFSAFRELMDGIFGGYAIHGIVLLWMYGNDG